MSMHISENASSHLGSLNSNSNFSYLFYKCLSGYETEKEFLATWKKIILISLKNHSWVDRLFSLREKWCTSLNNDVFNAGLKSASRSEGTNQVLNGIGHKITCLTKFMLELDRKIGEWRQKEADANFHCKQSKVIQIKESMILQRVEGHDAQSLQTF
ncbi:hypothetical protein M9H77_18583 [Catharanthus roseus]|uniref:Uncharacterized protein n=1 Tax=Catharanthus roseus TaxID=4058 RepID=A0ACC0B7V7_CATRO|nr:hypothetical protein M9H77_18583 [Catharanthus roseus]